VHRSTVLPAALALAFGLTLGGYALAQDQATPPAGDTALCATPLAEAEGTPAIVVTAPTTAATPGGVEPGTPVGLFPCATPINATPAGGTPIPETTGGTAVEVQFVDIAFVPAALTVAGDTDVPFRFTNTGAAPHNFTIDDPAVFSGDLGSGASADLVVNLPAGTYEYYCAIPGHKEAGMVGVLTAQ